MYRTESYMDKAILGEVERKYKTERFRKRPQSTIPICIISIIMEFNKEDYEWLKCNTAPRKTA